MKFKSRVILVTCLIGSIALTTIELPVAANPGQYYPPPVDTTFRVSDLVSGVTWLFLVNIILNLFFLTAFLYLLSRLLSERIGKLPDKARNFLLSVIVLASIVTFVGALVDYWLVMGVDESYDPESRVIVMDPVNWGMALALIFLSVAVPSVPLLRLSPAAAISLGTMIVVINPIWWIMANAFGFDVAMFTIIFGLILLPGLLKALVDFHNDNQKQNRAEATAGN